MLNYIKRLELVNIVLVLCWITSSITSLLINRYWFLEKYYLPFIFNISVTIVVAILNIANKLPHDRSNLLLKDYMYIICKSLFEPLKLLHSIAYSISSYNYFKYKEIEIDCFTINNLGVMIKSVFFIFIQGSLILVI